MSTSIPTPIPEPMMSVLNEYEREVIILALMHMQSTASGNTKIAETCATVLNKLWGPSKTLTVERLANVG